MKKLLIMVMCCKDDFFVKQANVIRNTWGKPILNGEYPNIDIIFYYGNEDIDSHKYVKDTHSLILRCEDNIENTYKKTYYAFNVVSHNFEYDYIFRTNTSTFVNVDLLNEFIQHIDDPYVLWCSELYSLSEAATPFPLTIFGRGNGLLFSNELINIILANGVSLLYLNLCDDWAIGNILNSYWMANHEDYLKHIKSFKHGWWKSISSEANNAHTLCNYSNNNPDFDFLKQFVTIQIKRYRERECETDNYIELNNIFVNNKDLDLDKTVNDNISYSNNSNVFLGSILGYVTLSTWLFVNKTELYNIEITNKADDDEQKYKHNIKLL